MDKKSTQNLEQLKIIDYYKQSHNYKGNKPKYFLLQKQDIIRLMNTPITCIADYSKIMTINQMTIV